MMEPPEIKSWEATGVLRFDHPVTEAYAKMVHDEVEDRIYKQQVMARTAPQPVMDALLPFLGHLLDPAVGITTAIFYVPITLLLKLIVWSSRRGSHQATAPPTA
jgi:hypothetical protein